jgi:hypothetical protein
MVWNAVAVSCAAAANVREPSYSSSLLLAVADAGAVLLLALAGSPAISAAYHGACNGSLLPMVL